MLPENKAFLESLKPIWEFYKLCDEIKSFDRPRLLQLVRQEWDSRYLCCLQCGADVGLLLKFAFTQYEKMPVEETKAQNKEQLYFEPVSQKKPVTHKKRKVK